jgi:hypothetical protein
MGPYKPRPPIDVAAILEDPSAHEYLKYSLRVFLTMDPVDAANDAELLAEIMRQRVENYL